MKHERLSNRQEAEPGSKEKQGTMERAIAGSPPRREPTPQCAPDPRRRLRMVWRSSRGSWGNATAHSRRAAPPGHRRQPSQPTRRFPRPAANGQPSPAFTREGAAGSTASSPPQAARRRRALEQPALMPPAPAPRLSAPHPLVRPGGPTVPVICTANLARLTATGNSAPSPTFRPAFFTAAKVAGRIVPAIAPSTAPRVRGGFPS